MNTAAARYWEGEIVDGRFPLLEWLGSAGGRLVFRTQRLGRAPAAIKLVPADAKDMAAALERWHQAAALSHANLVRLFESGQCQRHGALWLYLVMEYAEENLAQVLPQRPLSLREVQELLPPLLDALGTIHREQLVHGRVKPSNVVAVANQLKITSDSLRPLGRDRAAPPPTAYDAPENETRGFSPASDIWSLGMMLAAVFLQRPLVWSRESLRDPEVPASIPLPYRHIARECLRLNPDERCTLRDIREWLRPGAALELPRPVAPEQPKRAKSVALAILLLGVLISALVLVRHRAAQPAEQTQGGQPNPPAAVAGAGRTSASDTSKESRLPGAVRERVLPPVPESARQTIQGKVRVKVAVTVDPQGQVSAAELRSPGPSRYFARLALEAARQWKFQPVEVNGQPQESRWLIEFRFGRSSTEVIPLEQP
jgi:TonB family protein